MHDLIVRNGMIVDGTGFARYRADVGVKDGRIAEIGRIRAAAGPPSTPTACSWPPGSSTCTHTTTRNLSGTAWAPPPSGTA